MHYGVLRSARGWFGAIRSHIEDPRLQKTRNDEKYLQESAQVLVGALPGALYPSAKAL